MRIVTRFVLAASLVMRCGAAAMAQAPDEDAINPDRPGIADGSAVVGRGRIQIEVGYQYERQRAEGDTEHSQFLPALIRVGLGSRWEARIEGNTFTHVEGASGFSPISLGVKVHMRDSAGPRQPSWGAIVRVFPASGSGEFHANRATGDVRLAADWDVSDRLSLNPNAGVGFYETDRGERVTAGLFALTLNYANAAKTLNPFVDVGLQAPEASGGGAALIIDGGVAYLPTRDLQLDVSIGTGAHGRTPPDMFVSLGLSLRFSVSRR